MKFSGQIPKAETILLSALFFALPIAFSHLPYVFGLEYDFDYFGNYEWAKKALFFVMVGILLASAWIRNHAKANRIDGLFLWILSAVSIIQYVQGGSLDSVLFGTWPLFFGSLFLFMLWWLAFVLRGMNQKNLEIVRKWSILSLFFVTAYTVMQLFGYDPISSYSATFSLERAFSSLWNPNMLAGYALLLLPLAMRERPLWACLLSVMALLNILASGSASLALFAFLYVLWFLFRISPMNRAYFFVLLLIAGLSLLEIVGFSGLLQSKLLSLETRGALLVQAWSLFVQHPWALIFGFPSDILMDLLDSERIALVRAYIEDEVAIGNFHSLPVDILTRFWMVMFALIAYVGSLFLKKNRSPLAIEVAVLFGVFSLLHMPEVTHFAILLLATAGGKNNKK